MHYVNEGQMNVLYNNFPQQLFSAFTLLAPTVLKGA